MFKDFVLSAFSYLQEYGFRCVRAQSDFVRFESRDVFVDVCYDKYLELYVTIGRLTFPPQAEEGFDLGHMIDLAGAQEEVPFYPFQVKNEEGVKEFVLKLADLVKRYAERALRGEKKYFDLLQETKRREAEKYHKESRLLEIKLEAEKAWTSRNFEKMVKLYGSVRNELTPAEIKKLEYARKKLERK